MGPTVSINERLEYLSDYCEYGFPKNNLKILRESNMKVKDFESFPEPDGYTLCFSTKNYNFELELNGGPYLYGTIHDKKSKQVIAYGTGRYYYTDQYGEAKNLVDKETTYQINEELGSKLDEIGHKMNLQIYNLF